LATPFYHYIPLPRPKAGSIEVICGPMYSGKTEELIRRLDRVTYAMRNYVLFKPSIDTRQDNCIRSRSGREIPAVALSAAEDLETLAISHLETPVFAFDEVQFMDEKIVERIQTLADSGKRVIVSGLDFDYQRKPFWTMAALLAVADDVCKLKAVCMECGEAASSSFRKSGKGTQVEVGDQEYKALCRTCFTAQHYRIVEESSE